MSAVRQFIKYGIAGGAATGVHLVVFYALTGFLWPALTENDPAMRWLRLLGAVSPPPELSDTARGVRALWANGAAFFISNLSAYVMNILWVFTRGRHRWWVEIGLFYLVAAVSLVVGSVLQTWLIVGAGFSTTAGFGANVLVSLMLNYAMRKFVIFKG